MSNWLSDSWEWLRRVLTHWRRMVAATLFFVIAAANNFIGFSPVDSFPWLSDVLFVCAAVLFFMAVIEVYREDQKRIQDICSRLHSLRNRKAEIGVEVRTSLLTTSTVKGGTGRPVRPLVEKVDLVIRNEGPQKGYLTLRVIELRFDSGIFDINLTQLETEFTVEGKRETLPYEVTAETRRDARYIITLPKSIDFPTDDDWMNFLMAPGGIKIKIKCEVEQVDGETGELDTLVIEEAMTELRRRAIDKFGGSLGHIKNPQERDRFLQARDKLRDMVNDTS